MAQASGRSDRPKTVAASVDGASWIPAVRTPRLADLFSLYCFVVMMFKFAPLVPLGLVTVRSNLRESTHTMRGTLPVIYSWLGGTIQSGPRTASRHALYLRVWDVTPLNTRPTMGHPSTVVFCLHSAQIDPSVPLYSQISSISNVDSSEVNSVIMAIPFTVPLE